MDNDRNFKKTCISTFQKFDKDKSGFIEANEFVHVCKYFCKEMNFPENSQWDNYEKFKSLDTNKDGKLSFEEFSVLIKEVLEKIIDN